MLWNISSITVIPTCSKWESELNVEIPVQKTTGMTYDFLLLKTFCYTKQQLSNYKSNN